mmetsp:Transcript_30649/g.89078  ORF Transcript_30649/g.89078 Transcript_30649/m.89078 type:complete len:278 (+) Transcript_30649:260-1093(+)
MGLQRTGAGRAAAPQTWRFETPGTRRWWSRTLPAGTPPMGCQRVPARASTCRTRASLALPSSLPESRGMVKPRKRRRSPTAKETALPNMPFGALALQMWSAIRRQCFAACHKASRSAMSRSGAVEDSWRAGSRDTSRSRLRVRGSRQVPNRAPQAMGSWAWAQPRRRTRTRITLERSCINMETVPPVGRESSQTKPERPCSDMRESWMAGVPGRRSSTVPSYLGSTSGRTRTGKKSGSKQVGWSMKPLPTSSQLLARCALPGPRRAVARRMPHLSRS